VALAVPAVVMVVPVVEVVAVEEVVVAVVVVAVMVAVVQGVQAEVAAAQGRECDGDQAHRGESTQPSHRRGSCFRIHHDSSRFVSSCEAPRSSLARVQDACLWG
jgi:hypothetical protein